MEWWVAGYWILAAVAVLIAALLGVQTWEHRRFAWSLTARPQRFGPQRRVALLVPCKGPDPDMENNLRPLFEQDHENYELIFVVEGSHDSACPPIRRLMARYPSQPARLIIAGISTISGQKVHNLLAATEEVAKDVEILAFSDADVRPPRHWLRCLTQRLNRYHASTGYRWFVPLRPTWTNWMLSSMNGACVPILFPGRHRLVWGGSWAIRRSVFDEVGMRDAWQGTLSDDLVATRVLNAAGKRIAVEPQCILPSPIDVDFRAMSAFARRQFMIGRCYAPATWLCALLVGSLSQAVFWGSLAAVACGLAMGASWIWMPAGVAAVLYGLHFGRALLRQLATRYYLPDHQERLAAARRFDIFVAPLAAAITCCWLIGSAVGRRIVWKGTTYEMRRRGQIRIVARADRQAGATTDEHASAIERRRAA